MSRLIWNGKCSAGLGTCVLVNNEGWLVTAGHIVDRIVELDNEHQAAVRYEADRAAADAIGDPKERNAALKKLTKPAPESTRRFSVWFGDIQGTIGTKVSLKGVDLGAIKLENFDSSGIKNYPFFQDPAKDFNTGEMLCKLGFPFHSFTPIWHEDQGAFEFPTNALPLPLFPLEGMFTREVRLEIRDPNGAVVVQPYPLRWVETSSPGLMGQSGGPTFDQDGTIWAIQCITQPRYLGFEADIPNSKMKQHQFMNFGLGVHAVTLEGFFKQFNIAYQNR